MSADATEGETLFRELADLLSHEDRRVTRSTMMGFPCLRVDGKFFACVERATGNLGLTDKLVLLGRMFGGCRRIAWDDR